MRHSAWSGAIALVTGASRGVGPHIARALAAEGIHLALTATAASKGRLERVGASLDPFGVKTITLVADLTDPDQRLDLIRGVNASLGPVDILVNNAGVENAGAFADMTEADIGQVIDTNLAAPLALARHVLPEMIRRNRGAIINVASLAGLIPLAYMATYAASKAGLIAWTEAAASELAGLDIKVASVCPTFVSAEGMHARTGVRAPWIAGEVPPRKVARSVVEALSGRSHEILVTPMPTRPLLALLALFPGLAKPLKAALGLVSFMSRRAG